MGTAVRQILLLLCLCLCFSAVAEINHLELGAANYDDDLGSTHPHRFRYLIHRVEKLINEYGDTGVIYLNDDAPTGLGAARVFLQAWLKEKKHKKIKVELLPGNYNEIEIPKVKSANLGNPGISQLHPRNAAGLEKIAALSETGLTITTHQLSFFEQLRRGLSKTSQVEQLSENAHIYFHPNGTPEDLDEFPYYSYRLVSPCEKAYLDE